MQEVLQPLESDVAFTILSNERISGVVNKFAAEFEGVLALHDRHVVQHLDAAIGSSDLRPVASQPETAVKRIDDDDGKSEESWIGDAGIDAIGERINVGVDGQKGLSKTAVSNAKFIHEIRFGSPCPTALAQLSPPLQVGQPGRAGLIRSVIPYSAAAAVEIHSTY